eukprot:3257130-Rhodomonas_salina.1
MSDGQSVNSHPPAYVSSGRHRREHALDQKLTDNCQVECRHNAAVHRPDRPARVLRMYHSVTKIDYRAAGRIESIPREVDCCRPALSGTTAERNLLCQSLRKNCLQLELDGTYERVEWN